MTVLRSSEHILFCNSESSMWYCNSWVRNKVLQRKKKSEKFWKELGTLLRISLFFYQISLSYRSCEHDNNGSFLAACETGAMKLSWGDWNWCMLFLRLSRRTVLWCLYQESNLLYIFPLSGLFYWILLFFSAHVVSGLFLAQEKALAHTLLMLP